MEEKEYDYGCYEVKLNPLMNVQPDLWWIVLSFAGCALVAAVDALVTALDFSGSAASASASADLSRLGFDLRFFGLVAEKPNFPSLSPSAKYSPCA